MAGSTRNSSMRGGRVRRSMSDINVVPYIDVMLVLLVIFMVTAPLVTPGTIDLPSVAKSSQAPASAIEVLIKSDKTMRVRVRDPKHPLDEAVTKEELIRIVHQQQSQNPGNPAPVIIAADKTVQYDAVLQVMDALQKENIARVGLSVKPVPSTP
jgi:biopolymer transport protein TolR